MILWFILLGIFIGCLVCLFVLIIYSPTYNKTSFEHSIKLTELPVISFLIGDKIYNFLLDSGADFSIINESSLKEIPHTKCVDKGKVFGLEGNMKDIYFVEITLQLNNKTYYDKMQVIPMDNAFEIIKEEYGLTIHGVIGNKFMRKYNFVLDFNNLTVYSKKK